MNIIKMIRISILTKTEQPYFRAFNQPSVTSSTEDCICATLNALLHICHGDEHSTSGLPKTSLVNPATVLFYCTSQLLGIIN